MKKNNTAILLLCIILVSSFIQLSFIRVSRQDSDGAIIGLMAKHILKGEVPLFFYGQGYMGTLEAFFAAPFFLLFGASPFVLMHAIFFLSIIFILLTYILAGEMFGKRAALFAALYVAIPPAALRAFYKTAKGGYIETLIFGTLILLLTYRFVYRNLSRSQKRRTLIVLGFVSGIAWWTDLLIIYYILTSAVFLFLKDKKFFLKSGFWLLVIFFLIGSAPFWVYNFTHGFWSFKMGRVCDVAPRLEHLSSIFTRKIPALLEVRPIYCSKELVILGKILGVLYILLFIGVIIRRRKGLKNLFKLSIEGTGGIEMLFVFLVLVVAICNVTRYGPGAVLRYVIPLYSFFPLVIAYSLAVLWKRSKVFAAVILSFIMLIHLTTIVKAYSLHRNPEFLTGCGFPDNKPVIDFMKENEISAGYASYSHAPRITFESNEEIIVAEPHRARYPKYAVIADSVNNPAYIFWGNELRNFGMKDFREYVKAAGGDCKKKKIGRFSVHYSFSPPPYDSEPIPRAGWKGKSSHNEELVPLAFDDNISTRWTSCMPQSPGMSYELDLGRTYTVNKICFAALSSFHDFPHGYILEASVDGVKWSCVSSLKPTRGSFFWIGERFFWKPDHERMEICFEPAPARFLRLTQTGEEIAYYWSIEEIFVFSAEERLVGKEYNLERLIGFLNRAGVRYVYGDELVSSQITVETDDKIAALKPFYNEGRRWFNELFPKAAKITRLIDFKAGTAIVVRKLDEEFLESSFKRYRIEYDKEVIGGYRVYLNLEVPEWRSVGNCRGDPCGRPVLWQALDRKNWKVFAGDNETGAGKGIDGDVTTRWTSGRAQESGMHYGIDLGKRCRVTGIELQLGQWTEDYPRGYEVEVSDDGEEWTEAETVYIGRYYWSGFNILSMGQDGGSVRIKLSEPASVRYIKIKQTQSDMVYYWSIAEMKVFE